MRGNRYKATNFGNRVVVPSIQPIVTSTGLTVSQVLRGDSRQQFPRALVVEANLLDLDEQAALSYDAGSWVLAISAQSSDRAFVAQTRTIAPIVGYLSVGSGGVTHELIVDAWDTSINVPAGVCRLAVGYGFIDSQWEDVPTTSLDVPDEILVTATIQRSVSGGSSATYRRFFSFVGVGPHTLTVPVPNFSTCWRIFTSNTTPISVGSFNVSGVPNQAGGVNQGLVLDAGGIAVLGPMSELAASRRLPAGAETLSLTFEGTTQGEIQFEIGGLG